MDKMHCFVKTIKIMAIKTSREPEKRVFFKIYCDL